jgi:hypothetical protein
MQLYDITIAPNTTRQLDAPGSYFYYYAGSAGGADSTITMRGLSSGLRIVLKPGQAFRLPRGENETSWVLTNFSNTATILGTVIVGDGDITDNRVTGSVEVIDGGKSRTLANTAFSSNVYLGVTATNANLQIWNPSNSGKNVILEKFELSSSVDVASQYGFTTTQLSTLLYKTPSKLSGGLPGVAEARYGATGTQLMGATEWLGSNFMKANSVEVIEFREPIVIKPGYGFAAQAGMTGTLVLVAQHYEESI